MHHNTIAKVWSDDAEEARGMVESAMEESLESGTNEVGWDYVGEIELITQNKLSGLGANSFKELEKTYRGLRKGETKEMQGRIKELLTTSMAKEFLTKKEVPLYLNSEIKGLPKLCEKLLKKQSKDERKPISFEEILNGTARALCSEMHEDGMIFYYLKQIKKLHSCTSEELCFTLQCSHNYYAEINPDDHYEDPKVFYFACDRHC